MLKARKRLCDSCGHVWSGFNSNWWGFPRRRCMPANCHMSKEEQELYEGEWDLNCHFMKDEWKNMHSNIKRMGCQTTQQCWNKYRWNIFRSRHKMRYWYILTVQLNQIQLKWYFPGLVSGIAAAWPLLPQHQSRQHYYKLNVLWFLHCTFTFDTHWYLVKVYVKLLVILWPSRIFTFNFTHKMTKKY